MKYAVFLSGPIGVGKTTLGRALAASIEGGFIDGDDFSDPDKPWYCSILRTSIAVVGAGHAILETKPIVVIAYPLNCINWIYFRRKFGDAGIQTIFIGLRAKFAFIINEVRGRRFDEDERRRIRTMIAEGYGEKPFSDLVVDTDQDAFANTLAHLVSETQRMMGEDRQSHPAVHAEHDEEHAPARVGSARVRADDSRPIERPRHRTRAVHDGDASTTRY